MNRLYPVPLLCLLAALPLAAVQSPPTAQTPTGAPAARSSPRPVPSPTPAPVLEGTVKGPDDKPVVDALVFARPLGFGVPDAGISARTDAAGRFRLTLMRPVPHLLRVEARGLAGRTIEKARPGTPLDIALARGEVLEGTVRDGATGQPVPQARVEGQDESAPSPQWEAGAGVVETGTDAKGHFRLEGLSRGMQTVRARARGYGAGRQSGGAPGRPIEIYLFPGATLGGAVWGPGSVPVAGAIVRADPDTPRFRRPVRPVVTDAQGRYEIAGLDPGSYRVTARHKDFAPGVVPAVSVERGGDVQVDVTLDKGAALSGRLVTGPEPQAVAGRVFVQELDGQRAPDALREVLRAEAGADGRFRLESVPAGAHALAVTAPGYASKRVEVQVSPAAREVNLGDVELETGLTIRGRVRDRAGLPIGGATVVANAARRMPDRSVRATAEADGTFVLAGLEPGPQRLSATASGYAGIMRPSEAGAEKLDLVLSPAGSIAGTVVDDGGRPVELFNVNAQPAEAEANEGIVMRGPGYHEFNASDGRFLLDDLAEGTYVVEATAAERASGHVSAVKVAAGATTDVGTIRLPAGGTIRGTVVDGASAPVPGATVRVRGPGMEFDFGSGPRAVSDPMGAFELHGVRLGTAELWASHPNYADGRVSGIEVDPAKGAAEARIVLLQGGRVEGWVGRRDGTPVAGVYVRVTPQRAGGGPIFSAEGPGFVTSNADGTFVVEHLPPGRASVNLMARSGNHFLGAQSKEVDLRDGESTPVEFRSREILVSGHVTRAGSPVPGARVMVRGDRMFAMYFGGPGDEVAAAPAGPQRMTAVAAEDGGYELIVDEPGGVRVIVESADGRVSYPLKNVDVPDADAYTLELAFNVASVTGVVVDKDTERPVPRAFVVASRKPQPGAPGRAGATAGEDGRFQLELEPGDYRVEASAENYSPAELDITVGTGGSSDLKLALSRGVVLSGKVVDPSGRGIGGLEVIASAAEHGPPHAGGYAQTLPDGTFRIGGLKEGPYRLVARSELGAFATRSGVIPGDKDVVLTLRPGGRVAIRVLGPGGQPVAAASMMIEEIGAFARTDAQGLAELAVPAGTSEIRASKDRLEGKAVVTVSEGGTAAAEITLTPGGQWARPAGGGNP